MIDRSLIAAIEAAWEDRAALTPTCTETVREAVETTLDLLDRGEVRVAEKRTATGSPMSG